MMWRDRWWRMFDRDPIGTWVYGRIALLGDAAHPPLQYLAQGAIMAIEDGWVLAQHIRRLRAATADGLAVGWDAALPAHQAVRAEHCRRVILTARAWGQLWHLDGPSGGNATRSCARGTPMTTASPTGSTARPR
jgi:salicylate hydroxylase